MRILHVHSGNLYGGVERMLASFAATSQPARIEHQFALCFEGRLAPELRAKDVAVHRLGEVRSRYPLSVRRARRALRDVLYGRAFDAATCHMPWAQALFGPVIREAGLPLIFWMHDIATGRHWIERAARRTVPDLILCNSHFTARTSNTLYPGCRWQVVYPPVDADAEDVSEQERRARRDALETPSSAVVIVQASRLEAWKGHEVHLEALGQLRDLPDWVCWIAGGVQREHEVRYLRGLKALAVKLGIVERVRFCGEQREIRPLLRAADIYCQPNLRPEPFGIAFGEAMAAGLPVVTTGLGGVAELIDASCGLTVPANDAQALASSLRELIGNPHRRVAFGAAGAARVAGICDLQRQVRALEMAIASHVSARTAAVAGQ